MPQKKKNACPSANPQLYEKSMKPSMTLAMGLKTSQGASACWRAQVEAEERIHKNWSQKYNRGEERRCVEALEHTLQRESQRGEDYRSGNVALQTILYRSDGVNPRGTAARYLAERAALGPQAKYPQPQTSSQEVGWAVPEAMRSDGHFACARPVKAGEMRQAAAYRRPDDAEHAELFGYTFDRSY